MRVALVVVGGGSGQKRNVLSSAGCENRPKFTRPGHVAVGQNAQQSSADGVSKNRAY